MTTFFFLFMCFAYLTVLSGNYTQLFHREKKKGIVFNFLIYKTKEKQQKQKQVLLEVGKGKDTR